MAFAIGLPAVDVTVEEIACVVRLVLEVCDLWDDPRAWRECLLLGACQLLCGNVGSMHAVHFHENRQDVQTLAVVGLPAALAATVHSSTEYVTGRKHVDIATNVMPGFDKLYEEFARLGCATACRKELTDDATFYAAPMYTKFRQPLDCDDYVVSLRKVDIPERAEIIDIDRPHGASPFGPREVTLLKLLHDEIAPLVGLRLSTEAHLSRDGLSRRLNETLSLLLDGSSEKEAAMKLGISPRTLHEYVSTLYKHFSVTSRAELLAYFIRHRPEKKMTLPEGSIPNPLLDRQN